jgi:hypothetical protein
MRGEAHFVKEKLHKNDTRLVFSKNSEKSPQNLSKIGPL